jgi:hypothetical protein
MKLSMRVQVTHGEGTNLAGTPLGYTVLGLRPDQSARFYDFMGDSGWRMQLVKNGTPGDWDGHFKTAAAALEALQKQVDIGT